MIKKLIYINIRLLNALEHLQENHKIAKRSKQYLIEEALSQQIKKQKGEKITSPILSYSKPYIGPIVRGKETKRVEFGAKLNKIQIDGINYVEHISFNPFHEGIRYEQSVKKSEQLTRKKVKVTGSDAIYATNSNHSYARRRSIFTDFARKGRAEKNEKARKAASSHIRKRRGSRLEGSLVIRSQGRTMSRRQSQTPKSHNANI